MILHSNAIPWRLATRTTWLKTQRLVSAGCISCIPKQTFASSHQRWKVATQKGAAESRSTCLSLLSPFTTAIVTGLESAPIQKVTIRHDSIPLLVLLVTPAHIRLLDRSLEFIPNLLQHVFHDLKDGQHLDVLAAGVDRIPCPAHARHTQRPDIENSAVDVSSQPCSEHDSEGVSFTVLDSGTAAPNLWSIGTAHEKQDTMSIQQRCTLSFEMPPSAVPTPSLVDGRDRSQNMVSRVLQLPVANTLFQNGKTATLLAQRWELRHVRQSSSELSCIRETPVPRLTLRMTDAFPDHGTGCDQSLISHLTQITPSRTITAAVGNIIRRISTDAAATPSQDRPASEELEKAISHALEEDRYVAQHAGVWALITPASQKTLGASIVELNDDTEGNVELQDLILKGRRVHKVLSGGGGWGEKQGLLALDPAYDYGTSSENFDAPFDFDVEGDIESEKLQGLGQVVKPGDRVKFYINQPPPQIELLRVPSPNEMGSEVKSGLSMTFGSLPSTTDAMPSRSTSILTEIPHATCTILENHFGMLSEQGMSLQSTFFETEEHLAPEQLARGLPSRMVSSEQVIMTKLDAPHTTFSIREDLQTVGSVRKAAGINLQESNDEPVKSPVHQPQQPTDAKNIENDSKDEDLAAATSTSLDDFLNAISSMPPHQHIRSVRAGRQIHSREGKKRQQLSSALSAVVPPRFAMRKKLVDFPPTLKYMRARFENKNPQSPFSQLQQTLSNLSKAVTPDEESQSGDGLGTVVESRITRKKEEGQQGQSFGSADYGPRIYKHGAKMPLLLGPRLSDAARRAVIKGWTHEYEHELLAKSETEIGLDAPEMHRTNDGWDTKEGDPARQENKAETELTGPKIVFVADTSKNPLSKSETTSTSHGVPADRGRAPHGDAFRRLRVNAPQVKVRKHMAAKSDARSRLDEEPQHDKKLEVVDESGQVKEPRRIESSNSIGEVPTSYQPPADIDLPMLHIKSHLSHEAAPTNAREKARRLHREYHLPLLNQQPTDIPRP